MNPMGTRTLGVGVAVSALCAVLAQPARAQAPDPFQGHLARAGALQQTGRLPEAIAEYEAAYAIRPDAGLIYDIAMVYRQAGRLEEALATFRRFLASAPTHPQRGRAEGYVAEITTLLELRRGAPAPPAAPMYLPPPPDVQQALPPPPAPVAPTQIVASRSINTYLVRMAPSKPQPEGALPPPQCQTPCELPLSAGPYLVNVTGSGEFTGFIDLSGRPGTLQISHRNRVLHYGGLGMFVVGSTAFSIGLPLLIYFIPGTYDSLQSTTVVDRLAYIGGGLVGGGAALMLVGAVLWGVSGSDRVTLREHPTGPRLQGLGPVRLGPSGYGLGATFSF